MTKFQVITALVIMLLVTAMPITLEAAAIDRFDLNSAGFQWLNGTYLNFGTSVLEDADGSKNFYGKVGIIPMFVMDNKELALDLTIYFNENGDVRAENWDEASDLFRKVLFFRYNKPEDEFSANLEMIEDLTFGNGSIMRHYTNSLRYPLLDRKLGGTFAWNSGYDDKAILLVDDVASPKLFGARGYVQPHDNVIIGATATTDKSIPTPRGDKEVTILGADITFPFETKSGIPCRVYGEYNGIMDQGDGGHFGVAMDLGKLDFKFEHRRFRNDYLPNYFDHLYEMERSEKAMFLDMLPDEGRSTGWYSEFNMDFSEELRGRMSYQQDDGPSRDPHLSFGFDFNESLYGKFHFSFDYEKRDQYFSPKDEADAIYQAKAVYDINGSTHVLYHFKHLLDSRGNPANSINMETRIKF